MAGRHIRYNVSGKYYENSTSGLEAGPWTIVDLSGHMGQMIPPGVMWNYGGTVAPTGWLLCDGAAISRTTYAALFTAISTNFGVGDGSTTFNVPDFRGRVSVGTGQGSGLTNRTIGAIFGTETHVLTVGQLASHGHLQDPHTHTTNVFTQSGAGGDPALSVATQSSEVTTDATTATNQNTGGNEAHPNTQPSLVATKIIKI